jgi:hypothetical protein
MEGKEGIHIFSSCVTCLASHPIPTRYASRLGRVALSCPAYVRRLKIAEIPGRATVPVATGGATAAQLHANSRVLEGQMWIDTSTNLAGFPAFSLQRARVAQAQNATV